MSLLYEEKIAKRFAKISRRILTSGQSLIPLKVMRKWQIQDEIDNFSLK